MLRFIFAVAGLFPAVSSLTAASGGNDGETTFPFPADAPIVVSLNGYEKVGSRLIAMLAEAMPNEATILTKEVEEQLNKLIEGRKITEVRKDAKCFLVGHDLSGLLENKFPVSVLVPVTSYKKFRDSFLTKDELRTLNRDQNGVESVGSASGTILFLADLKEYVAISTNKDPITAYTDKYTAGSTKPMGREMAEVFVKADVALYLNMQVVNAQFGDQIRTFKNLTEWVIRQAIDQGKIQFLSKQYLNAVKAKLSGLFQGINDCRALILAAEFRADGLLFRGLARFAENSTTWEAIQAASSEAVKVVGYIPPGVAWYSENRLGDAFLTMMESGFIPTEGDQDGSKLIAKYSRDKATAGLRYERSADYGKGTVLTLADYKEPVKAVQVLLSPYKVASPGWRIKGLVVKTAPVVKERAESYRGFTFAEVGLSFDMDATVEIAPAGPLREIFLNEYKHILNGKTRTWIGTDGKVVAQVATNDWPDAKKVLDAYLEQKDRTKTLPGDPGFRLVRQQLPTDVAYLEINEIQSVVARYTPVINLYKVIPGFPEIGPVKPVRTDPAYVGYAVTIKGDSLGLIGFVPTKSVSIARKMFEGESGNRP